METIKEVLNGVKDRLSSPFFGALAVSWAICNWDILICLSKFDLNMLNSCGWSSYTECVSEQVGLYKSYIIPFMTSLGYVFGYPIFKGQLSVFNAWVVQYFGNKEIGYRKKSVVPVETIIRMQQELEKQEALLAARIEKNEENIKRAAEMQSEVQTLENKLTDLKDKLALKDSENSKVTHEFNRLTDQIKSDEQQIEKLKSTLSELKATKTELEAKNHQLLDDLKSTEARRNKTLDSLQGEWVNEHTYPNGKHGKEVFFIKGDEYFTINNNNSVKLATLKNIHWEKVDETELLVFTKSLEIPQMINTVVREHHRGKYLVNELQVEYDEANNMIVGMTGMEDGLIKIDYRRPNEAHFYFVEKE